MFPDRGLAPLNYRRIGRADLGAIAALDLDSDQVERFLDPIEHILAAVRGGPAHALFAIEAERAMIGFYVLHPDRRDNACWWLGWFALDRRQQGRGYGRCVMARIMAGFRRLPKCRRVRLLVTRDNSHALRLYAHAGFRRVGLTGAGDVILEAVLPGLTTGFRRRTSPGPRVRRNCRPRLSPAAHAVRAMAIERGPPGKSA
jgi:RimJ/RimL family protein N-acetyltransferase